MIDVENQIFTKVYDAIQTAISTDSSFPRTVDVTSEWVKAPAHLPHVSVIESDNYVDRNTRTSDEGENFAVLTYEVNVYSNLLTGKKTQAKKIFKVVDDAMRKMNFRRIAYQPVPNLMDATIYRLFGRYQVNVDKNENLYRR